MRQPIGIDRPIRPLRNEIIHDGEEAGGEEEADRIMAVPPLDHRILDARPKHIGFRREDRDRNRGIVAEHEHGDGHDEGEIEPVRHIDMRLDPLHDRAEEDQQISDPDGDQEKVGVPFGFGIFLRMGDAEQIAGRGDDDEEIIAEHDEPGRKVAGEPCPGRALHDIKRGGDEHIAAEGENHRRRVDRPQPPEFDPRQIEVQDRKGHFERDIEADAEADDAPEDRCHRCEFDRPEIIIGLAVDDLRHRLGRARIVAIDDREAAGACRRRKKQGMEAVGGLISLAGDEQREEREQEETAGEDHFVRPKRFSLRLGLRHWEASLWRSCAIGKGRVTDLCGSLNHSVTAWLPALI